MFKNSSAQAKMFYKIYSALQLALNYEKKHNFTYDYIVRTRADIDYKETITHETLHDINNGEIALQYTRFGPSDQFWIGNRNDMIKLCSVWNRILVANSFFVFKNIKCRSHKFLMMYLAKSNLATCPHGIKYSIAGATKDIPVNIKEALAKDFATTAAIYKDNEDVKKFFRFIAKDDTVC